MNRRMLSWLTGGVIAALLVSAVAVVLTQPAQTKHLSAEFPNTVSLYPGAKVQILGVQVGHVSSVSVRGKHVHVEMRYAATRQLPANVHAAIVPPALVGDRFVQLTPPYTGGKPLPDGANLGLGRTQVPLELDETYRDLNKLAKSLGPKGANKHGALSRLLSALAANLHGNGRHINDTTKRLSHALDTLSGSRGDIAGTVSNLGRVTKTLSTDDHQVRALVNNITSVSTELNRQRGDLRAAGTNLNSALHQVASFVKHNRHSLKTNIAGLSKVSKTLTKHQQDLAQTLDTLPLAATNLNDLNFGQNYDPAHPGKVPPAARTSVAVARANPIFDNLPTQLGHTVTALCAKLPTKQQHQLDPLCSALQRAGGDLGNVLRRVLNPVAGPGLTTSGPANTLPDLIEGGHQ